MPNAADDPEHARQPHRRCVAARGAGQARGWPRRVPRGRGALRRDLLAPALRR